MLFNEIFNSKNENLPKKRLKKLSAVPLLVRIIYYKT
jgi:hypothetical protein